MAVFCWFFLFQVAKLLNTDVYVIHKELVALLQDESLEVIAYSSVFVAYVKIIYNYCK